MNILGESRSFGFRKLDFMKDVCFISMSLRRVPIFHTKWGEFYQPVLLKTFIDLLTPYGFEKLHTSNFVNINRIEDVVEDKSQHPVGRGRKQGVVHFVDGGVTARISDSHLSNITAIQNRAKERLRYNDELVTTVIDPTGKKRPIQINLIRDVDFISVDGGRVPAFYTKYGTYYQSNSLDTFHHLTDVGFQQGDSVNLINVPLIKKIDLEKRRAIFDENGKITATLSKSFVKDYEQIGCSYEKG